MQRFKFPFDACRYAKLLVSAIAIVALVGACAVFPAFFTVLPPATQDTLAERFLWTVLVLYWLSLAPAICGGLILVLGLC